MSENVKLLPEFGVVVVVVVVIVVVVVVVVVVWGSPSREKFKIKPVLCKTIENSTFVVFLLRNSTDCVLW